MVKQEDLCTCIANYLGDKIPDIGKNNSNIITQPYPEYAEEITVMEWCQDFSDSFEPIFIKYYVHAAGIAGGFDPQNNVVLPQRVLIVLQKK
jgi:hypothetical protein